MLTKEEKKAIVEKYARGEGDTGSPEVQIALLTADINKLNEPFQKCIRRISIRTAVCLRKSVAEEICCKYLKNEDLDRYKALVDSLGLRR